jgi:CRISPR/Cas system-associated endonuclease Cas3-HD
MNANYIPIARTFGRAPGEPLRVHAEMSALYARFLAKVNMRSVCWAIKMLSEKFSEDEIREKIVVLIAEIAFIHDSGKYWKEWQDSLHLKKTKYLPHDVMSGLSLLDLCGALPKDATKYLTESEMVALRNQINSFSGKATELINICKKDKLLAFSVALAIMSHHCCNVSYLSSYLEEVRERGQMCQLVRKISEEWRKMIKTKGEETKRIAALSMLIATIVESDWGAARTFEKLREDINGTSKGDQT